MAEERDAGPTQLVQLMAELVRLEEEQRALDLRDPEAVADQERKIAVLREKIGALLQKRASGQAMR